MKKWWSETAWPALRKISAEALAIWGAGVRDAPGSHLFTLALGLALGVAFAKAAL